MNSVQQYLKDEKRFALLIGKHAPKSLTYSGPERPGLLIRCGFGRAPFVHFMRSRSIWEGERDDWEEIIRIYRKWKGKDMWHYD